MFVFGFNVQVQLALKNRTIFGSLLKQYRCSFSNKFSKYFIKYLHLKNYKISMEFINVEFENR